MSNVSRRGFLGAAGLGLAASMSGSLRGMNAGAPLAPPGNRLITIFLRGAHDGVHTVVPVGDASWVGGANPLRPSTFSPPTTPLSGTTFAALNANYGALTANTQPFFAGTPPDLAGHVAWIHQVGHPTGQRSHFTEQQIFETADVQPAASLNREGFVPRVRQRLVLANPSLPQLWGASVSYEFQRMYRSTHPQGLMVHADVDRLGTAATAPVAIRQRLALAQHLPQVQADPLAESVRQTSTFAFNIETALQTLTIVHDAQRFPQNATEAAAVGLPASPIGFRFMRDCELALLLAGSASTNCRMVGVEVGGWDTHGDQVAQRSVLDKWLAHALRALYDLTVNQVDHYTILVVTEFGRTNAVNTAAGTDHGVGGLMTVIGRKVNGGVYNCRSPLGGGLGAAWVPATGTFTFPNAQNVATDFRTVYAEILQKRFGLSTTDLGVVIPGFTIPPFLNCIS